MIDIFEETVDPKISMMKNEAYKQIFLKFHETIINNGLVAVKEVGDIYEFIVQLDNDKKLSINKATAEVWKDYIDFTIDLKHDRGKIYVGNYKDHVIDIGKES